MRKIDCAHSRSVKTFVWPLKIENTYFYPYKNTYFNPYFFYFWAKKSKINFFSIIFFANQIRWLERSIEIYGDGNGFKLDFWRIFEMWEQSKNKLYTKCTHYLIQVIWYTYMIMYREIWIILYKFSIHYFNKWYFVLC